MVTKGLDALTRLVRSCVPRAHDDDDDAGGCLRNGVKNRLDGFRTPFWEIPDSGTYHSVLDYDCE